MIRKEEETKKVKVITNITCDSCGESCMRPSTGNYEYIELKGYWGYGTKKDGEKWTAQICEKCVDEKFSFINFKKEEYELVSRYSTMEEENDYLDKLLIGYSNKK